MARSFNDLTDRIDYTATWNPQGDPFSLSAWIYRTQGAEHGYFWHRGVDDSNFGISVSHPGNPEGAGTLQCLRVGSTELVRVSDPGEIPADQWCHIMVTHDGTFGDYTTLHLYVDGSEVTYKTNQSGSNESSYAATYWSIGGRDYDDLRNWGGYIAEVGVWSANMAAAVGSLAVGYSPLFYPTNLRFCAPLIRSPLDWINGDYGTLDGTTVIAHPPKVKPWWFVPRAARAISHFRIAVRADNPDYLLKGVKVVA